jgi:hypothetical protein
MKNFKPSYQLGQKKKRASSRIAFLTILARIGLLLTFLAVGANAQTYSAVTDFSVEINTDASPWSYRYNTTGTRDGNYTLLPAAQPMGSQWYDHGKKVAMLGWFSQANNTSCPCIAANKGTSPLTTNYGHGTVVLPSLSILEHPSTSSSVGDTALSFLVPKKGKVTVTYSFTDIDPFGGNGINWYVDLNSGVNGDLYSGTVHSTPGHIDTTGERHFELEVAEGDRLNFVIDSNGDFYYDSTAVRATVAYQADKAAAH